ncbi:MAG: NosD domain-containing protein [Promethearchaeota archaeon]
MISKKVITGMLLYLSVFWLVFPFISFSSNLYHNVNNYNNADSNNKEIEKKLKNSKSWNLTGTLIYIDDKDLSCNWSKTASENEWCTGLGTWKDPYLIENVTIDMQNNTSCCLTIANSTVPFIIQNCQFTNSRLNNSYINPYWLIEGGGIVLFNVSNGLITRNTCSSNTYGICTLYGVNNSIQENYIVYNDIGILNSGDNIMISINIVKNNELGIIYSGNNNTVSTNTVINSLYGIIGTVYNSIISKNTVKNNSNGIMIYGEHNTISSNKVSKNLYGIQFYGENNIISLNIINESKYYGIYLVWAQNCLIIENSVSYNNRAGILLEQSSYINISKNECCNNKLYGICINGSMISPFPPGELYPSVGNNWILENQVNNNSYGIMLNYTLYDEIINNTINNNNYCGIALYASEYINIGNNNINGNYYGITLNVSRVNDIRENSISNCFYGIILTSSDFVTIKQNLINNSFYGIILTSSDIAIISSNLIYFYKICIKEQGDCFGNIIEDNECIKLKKNTQDWTLLIIITVSASLAIAIILFIFFLYRRKISR